MSDQESKITVEPPYEERIAEALEGIGGEIAGAFVSSNPDVTRELNITDALTLLAGNLRSPNESDSNGEAANVVDGLFAIARGLHAVAEAIKAAAWHVSPGS